MDLGSCVLLEKICAFSLPAPETGQGLHLSLPRGGPLPPPHSACDTQKLQGCVLQAPHFLVAFLSGRLSCQNF